MLSFNTGVQTLIAFGYNRLSNRSVQTSDGKALSPIIQDSSTYDRGKIRNDILQEVHVERTQCSSHHLDERIMVTQVSPNGLSEVKELSKATKHIEIDQFKQPVSALGLNKTFINNFPRVHSQADKPKHIETPSILVSTERFCSLKSLIVLQKLLTSSVTQSDFSTKDRLSIVTQEQVTGKLENNSNAEVQELITKQLERYQNSRARIQKLMDIIVVAQQRSDSLIANLTALRQLSTVQLKEQSRETEEDRDCGINIFARPSFEES